MENGRVNFSVNLTDRTFESEINRATEDPEFIEQLNSANALIVPQYGVLDYPNPLLPKEARNLYRHLLRNAPGQLKVDVAIHDENYQELLQHADWIALPVIVLSDPNLCPIIIKLIAGYIQEKISKAASLLNSNVKSELIISKENGQSLSFKYEGPAKTFEKTLLEGLREYLSSE